MSHEPIELGLFRPERVRSKALLGLVRELLDLLAEMSPESEVLDTLGFRKDLEEFAARIEEAQDERALERVAAECAARCSEYYRKAQDLATERDTELTALVGVVEQLVATVVGDAAAMDEQLANSSDRLGKVLELNDLRILKRRLSLEVTTLKRVIDEQREQHERQRDKMTSEVGKLQKRLVRAKEEATLDGLTRVGNRARFDRALRSWVNQHKQNGQSFVLAMVDLDNFKDVNDRCGHQAGDKVLVDTAAVLTSAVRPSDVVARYGGDEFGVMLAGMPLANAEPRFRQVLSELLTLKIPAPSAGGAAPVLSASIGITEFDSADTPADILGRADRALYDAKNAGKATVRCLRRPSKSKLFQNGRPVAGAASQASVAKKA
jgi:diguanylate cyclase (GGDEF)-like protein